MLLTGLVLTSQAQNRVELRDLEVNKMLHNAEIQQQQRKSLEPPLSLPFLDDFSSPRSPYPNPKFWQDNKVFINTNYPLLPPTIGVATFDALDENGQLYDPEHLASYPFSADTLTSQPIRLDSVWGSNPRDLWEASQSGDTTVFFSFYYQPGGGFGNLWESTLRGRQPIHQKGDLLILEFLDNSGEWNEIWSTEDSLQDYNFETFCPPCMDPEVPDQDKPFFKQVAIPIDTKDYLYNGFQFRFRNITSLDQNFETDPSRQSAGGQWHIDYVHIDAYSDEFTPFLNDIAFVEPSQRVLKEFQAMPARQFRGAADLVSEIPLLFRNMNDSAQADYQYQIFNQAGDIVHDIAPSNQPHIPPFFLDGFFRLNIPLENPFPIDKKPDTFEIYHTMKQPADNSDRIADNDTMIQIVSLSNYYAYDDGTPEMNFGFVVQAERATSRFAYQFPMREKDTLIGVQIWFNPTKYPNMDRALFDLTVWNAVSDGTSDTTLRYVERDLLPPQHAETIGFSEYWFEEPVYVDTGSLFIGFQQHHNIYLCMGFDQNNNAENRMFLYGMDRDNQFKWIPVLNYGAVMMRPVFGSQRPPDPTTICRRDDLAEHISVFPNPSDGMVFVESPEILVNSYEIYNMNGQRMFTSRTSHIAPFSINISYLPRGVYILVLHTERGVVSKKIIRQ